MNKADLKTDRGVQISDRRMYSVHRKRKEALANKPTRYYSRKQEKSVAKELGGNTTPNSGATMFSKGDVTLDDWLIECKTKTSPSLSMNVKKDWLEKNEEEAFAMGKSHNALIFDFGDTHYPQEYVIISLEEFKNLLKGE